MFIGQLHRDLQDKTLVFSTLSMCSDHMLSNKVWLYCPYPLRNPLNKGLLNNVMKNQFFVAFTNSEKKACNVRDTFDHFQTKNGNIIHYTKHEECKN